MRVSVRLALSAFGLAGFLACGSTTPSADGTPGTGGTGTSPTVTSTNVPPGTPTTPPTGTATGTTPPPVTPPVSGTGLFQNPMPWTTTVDTVAKSTESDAIIAALNAAGGWGTTQFLTERSLTVLASSAATPIRPFTKTGDFFAGDCDDVPFPVPAGGAVEGNPGYACVDDGDCHLLVVDSAQSKLFEMWRANIVGSSFQGGCVAVWDLKKAYGPTLRGKSCTSADAGGFPIAAMLASPDEAFAGEIKHALRYTLPGPRMLKDFYVQPATHTAGATGTAAKLPPYGTRLRLKPTVDVSKLPKGAQVIANALKKYGMFLADRGNVPLTIMSDRFTTHKWAETGLTADNALAGLKVTDFEVVEFGTRINYAADDRCVRNP